MRHHNRLWNACAKLPGDYSPYGDDVRWADPKCGYPDCSCGCQFFYVLEDRDGEEISCDWGVCTNAKSHRCGLLTFEHQGCEFFRQKRAQRKASAVSEPVNPNHSQEGSIDRKGGLSEGGE